MTTVVVTVDVPEGESTSPVQLASELRLLWILEQVRCGRVSVGKGAELAGTDRWSFTATMNDHGIPIFGYPASELSRELEVLDGL